MAAGGTAAAVAAGMASRTMGLMSAATANQVRLRRNPRALITLSQRALYGSRSQVALCAIHAWYSHVCLVLRPSLYLP